MLAVPGEIGSTLSAGTNALLKLGATPLTSSDDVLAAYGLEPATPQEHDSLLDLLPATVDELVRRTGQPASDISATLIDLELAGRVGCRDGVYRID